MALNQLDAVFLERPSLCGPSSPSQASTTPANCSSNHGAPSLGAWNQDPGSQFWAMPCIQSATGFPVQPPVTRRVRSS